MNTLELEQAIRLNTTLPDGDPDYTQAVILREMNDKNRSVFGKPIVTARAGYWLQQQIVPVTAQRKKYRIPPRAAVGGLEKVEMLYANTWIPMREAFENHAGLYETVDGQAANTNGSSVPYYVIRGDQVELLPTPTGTSQLRLTYYRRPSLLVASQSAPASPVRGTVLDVNTTTREITVDVLPNNQVTNVAIASGSLIDVIHPDGWYELALCNATVSIFGTVLTVAGDDPLDEIEVGDFVRAAGQTDWPQLPEDFHRLLADVTSSKILVQKAQGSKAAEIAAECTGDMERFRALLSPRTRSQPRRVPITLITRRGMYRWGWP